jgi:hypothetical protein
MTLDISEHSIEKFRFRPNSSLVETLDYDSLQKTLSVRFKRGRYKGLTRLYKEVAPEDFCTIMSAESIGKAVIKMAQTHQGETRKSLLSFPRFLNSIL